MGLGRVGKTSVAGMTTTTENFEDLVKMLWKSLTPSIDTIDREILLLYYRKGALTPYMAARLLGMNTATVYRRVRRLAGKLLLLPADENSDETMRVKISAKGCIALYVNNSIDSQTLKDCASKAWGIDIVSTSEILGFLYVLGLEAQRRQLNLTTMTMCSIDEAAIHVIRVLKKAIVTYVSRSVSFKKALDMLAKEMNMPSQELRDGIRLALRGLADKLPLTVNTRQHRLAVFVQDRTPFVFVVECTRNCKENLESLGFECPRVMYEFKRCMRQVTGQWD